MTPTLASSRSRRARVASNPGARRPKRLAPLVAAAAAWILAALSASSAAACEVCFGAARNSGSAARVVGG
jgi:hypothetical protein